MKILFSDSAFSDLEGLREYYFEEGVPDIGHDFVVAIFEHVETLLDHPDIGRVVPEFDQEHIRELIHSPFRIVYLRDDSSIQIIRIWRSERKLVFPDTD